jgi:hypothetical protein
MRHYQQALATDAAHPRANLGLGSALLSTGSAAAAQRYLAKAAESRDQAVSREARELLKR